MRFKSALISGALLVLLLGLYFSQVPAFKINLKRSAIQVSRPILSSEIQDGVVISQSRPVPPPNTSYSTITLARLKSGEVRGYVTETHAVGTRKNFKMVSSDANLDTSVEDLEILMTRASKLKRVSELGCVGGVTSILVYRGGVETLESDTCSDRDGVSDFAQSISLDF